jgi:hypothetical protein
MLRSRQFPVQMQSRREKNKLYTMYTEMKALPRPVINNRIVQVKAE